ncbi:hypothetical protein TNCV_1032921 [Trichonephila clavipes]|nr:hypothetical protein TNCV_1032921 [Trichonephila clavipes]
MTEPLVKTAQTRNVRANIKGNNKDVKRQIEVGRIPSQVGQCWIGFLGRRFFHGALGLNCVLGCSRYGIVRIKVVVVSKQPASVDEEDVAEIDKLLEVVGAVSKQN